MKDGFAFTESESADDIVCQVQSSPKVNAWSSAIFQISTN